MSAILDIGRGELPGDADAAMRHLYAQHASAPRSYVERFCPDRASADDIVQETFIRAWRLDRQLVTDALRHLSPAHRAVLMAGPVRRSRRR